jgi:hypothetical protein
VSTLAPLRPIARYPGSKYRLAPKFIIPHIVPHRIYVEPFCGVAGVLLHKRRSSVEILNDLNAEHTTLCEAARALEGYCLFSGYPSELYRDQLEAHGWERKECVAHTDGHKEAIECLWLSPRTASALDGGLFGGVA